MFERESLEVARVLLGWTLLCESPDGLTGGIIVETEAYTHDDPASHSYRGLTNRNTAMFGPPGCAYTYRIHQETCFNVVTGPEGLGEAVLIRALEPTVGLPLMRTRRPGVKDTLLCAGPGRLCRALGITMALNGVGLGTGCLRLLPPEAALTERIGVGPRIGIRNAVDWPRRFYLTDNPFISKR